MKKAWKVGVLSLLAVVGVLLAQEEFPPDSAITSFGVTVAEFAALIEQGVGALDAETRSTLTSALAGSLESLRDEAIARGVEPMPREFLEAFSGHLPNNVLANVRWRVEPDSVIFAANVFSSGMRAVALDNVILFVSAEEAENVKLWAHELYHVLQYRQWGTDGFIERYLADRGGVEREAWEFRWQWRKATGCTPPA